MKKFSRGVEFFIYALKKSHRLRNLVKGRGDFFCFRHTIKLRCIAASSEFVHSFSLYV